MRSIVQTTRLDDPVRYFSGTSALARDEQIKRSQQGRVARLVTERTMGREYVEKRGGDRDCELDPRTSHRTVHIGRKTGQVKSRGLRKSSGQ